MAALDKTKAMVGRVVDVDFLASSVSAKKLDNVKFDSFNNAEEVKELNAEMEDGQEINTPYSRKFTFDMEFSELDTTDITAIETADEVQIISSVGGTNSTGLTLGIATLDDIKTEISGLKVKVTARKTTASAATKPYTITDNPV